MLYTVGEMANIMGVAASTLRYYDKEGLLPSLGRSKGNMRMFSDVDYEALQVIECLKKSGLSISDIKAFMDMVREGDSSLAERLELFRKRRKVLEEKMKDIKQTLDMINYKCWYYEMAKAAGTEEFMKNLPLKNVPKKYRAAKIKLCSIDKGGPQQ